MRYSALITMTIVDEEMEALAACPSIFVTFAQPDDPRDTLSRVALQEATKCMEAQESYWRAQ
jgi:hypothetical protein